MSDCSEEELNNYPYLVEKALNCLEKLIYDYIEKGDKENLEALLEELEDWEFAFGDLRSKVEGILFDLEEEEEGEEN